MSNWKRAALAIGLSLSMGLAFAFPEKPVHIVVPYPAAGPIDMATRIIAERLQKAWGQPVIVENRPGASGAIGTEYVVKSPADGYTLLVHSPIMIATELNRPSVRYRTSRDLVPVSLLLATPVAFVVSNEWAPGGGLNEILAAAARPGELSFGSHGEGTTAHYMGERLSKAAKVQMTHVPYAGEAPIITALMGGHVKSAFISGIGAKKVAESGKGRIVAVASNQRSAVLPGVATFAQLGYSGFDRSSWGMVLAPKATPPAVVAQIAQDIDRIVKQPDVRQRFMDLGVEAKGGTPVDAASEVQLDYAFWNSMISEFGALSK